MNKLPATASSKRGTRSIKIPPHLRAGYDEYFAPYRRRVLITSSLMILATFSFALPMDWFFFRKEFGLAILIRLGIILPCGLSTLAFLRSRSTSLTSKQKVASAYVILCAALVGVLIARSADPQAAGYLIGNFILMFFSLVFMGLPRHLLIVLALSVFSIQSATIAFGVDVPSMLQLHNVISGLVFIPLSYFVGWQMEKDRRRQYLMLERERINLRKMADQRDVLARLAALDPLTGLANRRGFNAAWDGDIERAGPGVPLAIAMVDIDDFKAYNDFYGHRAGDEALRIVAEVLENAVGAFGRAGRFGGEEFVVGFASVGREPLLRCVERIRADVQHRGLVHEGCSGHGVVTVSIGLAIDTIVSGDSSPLIEAADRALYRAKKAGRNRVEIDRHSALQEA